MVIYMFQKNYLDVYRFETWGGSMIPTYNNGQQASFTRRTLFVFLFLFLCGFSDRCYHCWMYYLIKNSLCLNIKTVTSVSDSLIILYSQVFTWHPRDRYVKVSNSFISCTAGRLSSFIDASVKWLIHLRITGVFMSIL